MSTNVVGSTYILIMYNACIIIYLFFFQRRSDFNGIYDLKLYHSEGDDLKASNELSASGGWEFDEECCSGKQEITNKLETLPPRSRAFRNSVEGPICNPPGRFFLQKKKEKSLKRTNVCIYIYYIQLSRAMYILYNVYTCLVLKFHQKSIVPTYCAEIKAGRTLNHAGLAKREPKLSVVGNLLFGYPGTNFLYNIVYCCRIRIYLLVFYEIIYYYNILSNNFFLGIIL